MIFSLQQTLTSQHGAIPDRGLVAEEDVASHRCAGRYEGAAAYLGRDASKVDERLVPPDCGQREGLCVEPGQGGDACNLALAWQPAAPCRPHAPHSTLTLFPKRRVVRQHASQLVDGLARLAQHATQLTKQASHRCVEARHAQKGRLARGKRGARSPRIAAKVLCFWCNTSSAAHTA